MLELKVCIMHMHGHEDASDLLLEMVCYTKTLELIHDHEPSSQLFFLLKQKMPHSLLQACLE